MQEPLDQLQSNPFIHGTSSETLSLMQSTNFQLMPVIAMLQTFKVAPIVGELTKGGFSVIGDDSNKDTITGAPAFGRMNHSHYNLDKVIGSYTKYSDSLSLDVCKENFREFLGRSHKSAFTNLNLLMIYLVRLRQLGVKAAEIAHLDEISALKARLNATIQFYYFVLCVQKYIFIDCVEMERFKQENNLEGIFAVGDYIEHYFSFEKFLEKIQSTRFNIEEIYTSPSAENINKLIEFVKISKDSQENVRRHPCGEDKFIAKCDYRFFSPVKHELKCNIEYEAIGERLFTNNSGYSFSHYLEKYHQSYGAIQKKEQGRFTSFPHFEKFHTAVSFYIAALKDRIQLCNTLLDADDNEFVLHNKSDGLLTKPFPIVFVTEAKTLESFHHEYRSREPLKLGKEILLVATDNKDNQKRLRDYLQINHVGPAEVLLLDDLKTLSYCGANYFDAFANDDLIKAFELAKKQNCVTQLSKLYRALAELNEKRYRFKSINPEMYLRLSQLFIDVQKNILTPDKDNINFRGMQSSLQLNKQENYGLYATHRGVLGVIDTLLTILASLVLFYPITYLVQKSRNSMHTFFATDTEKKINNVLDAANEIMLTSDLKTPLLTVN